MWLHQRESMRVTASIFRTGLDRRGIRGEQAALPGLAQAGKFGGCRYDSEFWHRSLQRNIGETNAGRSPRRCQARPPQCQDPPSTPASLPVNEQVESQIVTLHDSTRVKILLSQQQIEQGVARLAEEVRQQYGKQPLTIIGIMTGSIMLLADLVRLLEMPLRVGVIQTSSYRTGTTRGELTINATLLPDIRDRDVLLLDDIFDTGHTLTGVIAKISEFEPRSLRSAVLLSKTGRCEVDMRPDFVTFDIPDEFVIGYGLDYEDEYRNLPYIGSLDSAQFGE